MLKLIIGVKGTGKTKTLINLVNGALEVTKGDVVLDLFDLWRCRICYERAKHLLWAYAVTVGMSDMWG